jgi:hypothetical protein
VGRNSSNKCSTETVPLTYTGLINIRQLCLLVDAVMRDSLTFVDLSREDGTFRLVLLLANALMYALMYFPYQGLRLRHPGPVKQGTRVCPLT